jgi:MoaA/NifB/PqqE/SkfB family radical SAM enzyme
MMGDKSEVNTRNYMRYQGKNPFGGVAKLLLRHPDRINQYQSEGETIPVSMEVNLTNKCNLACKWCISENARGGETLNPVRLYSFLQDFYSMGGKSIVYSGGGEPTCHPDFERVVKDTKSTGLDMGLMTNGTYNPDYASAIGNSFQWVRFSLDTLDRNHYTEWKGRDLVDKVKSNVIGLKDFPIKVGVNCNVGTDLTLQEIDDMVDWAVGGKNSAYLQFRPVTPRPFTDEKIKLLNPKAWDYLQTLDGIPGINLSNDKLSDFRENNAFSFEYCDGHFITPVLDADGQLKVCMHKPRDPLFDFGNIDETTSDTPFQEIWNSQQRQDTIARVRELDYSANCQFCCKLAEINKTLDGVRKENKMEDENFI